jgi:hypothetical protein
MLCDIDLDLNSRIVAGPGVREALSRYEFKRDTATDFRVRFWRNGIVVELDPDAAGQMGLKPFGKYDAAPLVLAESWEKSGEGEETLYTFYPEFNGEALALLLGADDGNPNNDLDFVRCMLEIKWLAAGKKGRTQTVESIVYHDVLKDDENTPARLPDPAQWMPAPLVLEEPPIDGVGTAAVGSISVVTIGSLIGKTITIGGQIYTFTNTNTGLQGDIFVDSPEFQSSLAAKIRDAINARVGSVVTATAASVTVTLTAKEVGTSGNAITLETDVSPASFAISGPTLTGGGFSVLGTVPAAPGQIGIYAGEVAGQPVTVSFRALSVSPAHWEAATPGLFRDPDNAGQWRLQKLNSGLEITFPALT